MRIAGYEMGELLGKGRFGEVRLVTHPESGGQYACKITAGDAHRKLLRWEAEMQRELTARYMEQCAGGPPFFPVFRELIEGEDKTFLIMEYVRGVPLSKWLRTGGADEDVSNHVKLSESEMLSIALQLAEGLKIIHERLEPVLYRDLKPEHVMLCGKSVRLLDLGCACRQSEAWKSKAGSRGYAAPEQLNEGAYEQGIYSDIYSFGKVLEAMTASGHAGGDWKRLTAWCTAENPKDRIPCMRLVLRELRRMQQGKIIAQHGKMKAQEDKIKAQRGKMKAQPEWMRFRVEKCICS